jgi:outer membrane lipoprotein-sorting protein
MKTKKIVILIILAIIAIALSVLSINIAKKPKGSNISPVSPASAILTISKKYDIDKSLLEYGGIDEGTNLYIINLSPGESKGAAGRTFYVDPMTGDVKE